MSEEKIEINIEYLDALLDIKKMHRQLKAENKILKEALEFYADEDSWCHSYGTNNNNVFDVYGYPNEKKHGCLKARQALEKIK